MMARSTGMRRRGCAARRWVAVLAALIGFQSIAAAGSARNKELYVVPVPEAVAIDGALDDWDFSGHLDYYVVPETRETQSGQIAMMYDAEALYVGGTVRDSSPMMNRHDPKTKPSRAWDADVCQIFFSLDPDEEQPLKYGYNKAHKHVSPVATMMLWYFTDRSEPSLAMFRGMGFTRALNPELAENGYIPPEHFQAAYQKGEDGLSYSFEYRIPWTTLKVKRTPKAKDTLAAAAAIFWGRRDGLKTAGGAAWAWNLMSQGGFPYQTTGVWGTLRFWPEGNIPRKWIDKDVAPEQPLPLTFAYSLPREGECTIQLFNEKNESVRILVPQQRRPEGANRERWDGLDQSGKPLPAGTYTWRGLVHDPLETTYRFSAHNSGTPPYPTADNTGGWGGDHGGPTTVLAIPGGMILAWHTCEFGWGIIRTDLKGKKKWGSKRTADFLASDGKRLFVAGGHGWSNTGGVTVLELASSRTLNFQPGQESLQAPAGGDKETNTVTGLACDGTHIYVAYAGRDLMAVFDLKGNLTASWSVPSPGSLALRPDGSLAVLQGDRVIVVAAGEAGDALITGLEEPRGLAVAENGEIYVAQAGTVQQIHVFSAAGRRLRTLGKAGGRPAKGRYDRTGLYEPGGIDIDEEGRVWVAERTDAPKRISVWDGKTGENVDEFFGSSSYFAYGHIDPDRPDEILAHNVLWRIDWKKNKVSPHTTVWRKTAPGQPNPPGVDAYKGNAKLMTAKNGHQYLVGNGKVFRRDGDLFKPFLAFLGNHPDPEKKLDMKKRKNRHVTFLWQDGNDDQTIQGTEVVRLSKPTYKRHLTVNKELTLYIQSHRHPGLKLPRQRLTETGQPLYDTQALTEVPVGIAPESDGFTYPKYGSPTIARRSLDGKTHWAYTGITHWKRALSMGVIHPGDLWGTTGKLGLAGDYLAYMVYWGVNHVFHAPTGVYVGDLLSDGRLGQSHKHQGSQPEGQGGSFVKLTVEGKDRYFLIHGGQDTRVWEVLGLGSLEVLAGGTYAHTAEAVAAATKALAAWEAAKAGHSALTLVQGRAALEEAAPVGKELKDGRGFAARVAYDEANLYVHYAVTTPHGLTNATPEDPLIFRGGNCLDLQIATHPKTDPKREQPAPGDVRLLVTRRDNKPFAMVYRPRVQGFKGKPIVLQSPTGNEPFDRIESTDRVGLAYEKTDTGFTAVVTVPLDLLGWQPEAGASVKMDLGYIFGNEKGTRAQNRIYWSNNSFSANVVDDIPNESRLEPDQWGTGTIQ